MNVALLLLALAGHGFLWIGLVNRFHALGIPRAIIKSGSWIMFACAASLPFLVAWALIENLESSANAVRVYLALCWSVAPATLVRLAWIRWRHRRPSLAHFRGAHVATIDRDFPATTAKERFWRPFIRLPMNEILRPVVSEWELDIPRLPSILDGLSIVQLSDLHFSGRIGKTYFREIVRICNEQESELVCITGDIVDKTACFDWLPETLGRLSARHGVYFILGNHDLQVDSNRVRQILEQSGLIDLGSRCHRIEISGTPILLTGNERPWFHGAVGFTEENDALPSDNSVLRIVLAHCPDQFTWARRQHADLMLAGHTHGGQIRIPPLGAIFSPTLHGVKFISGVYDLPPTILHVSRGTSGDTPVRWNCPPEICHLRLRSTQKSPGRSQ